MIIDKTNAKLDEIYAPNPFMFMMLEMASNEPYKIHLRPSEETDK